MSLKKYSTNSMEMGDTGHKDISFDPACAFFEDLRVSNLYLALQADLTCIRQSTFAGTLEFFYDSFGGTTIGAVWDPSVICQRPFRVLSEYSSTPSTRALVSRKRFRSFVLSLILLQASTSVVKVNEPAILVDIQRMGEGIVDCIVIQNNKC